MKVRVEVDASKCIMCMLCVEYCPAYVFSRSNDKVIADSSKCIECYGCVPLCPTGAIAVKLVNERLSLEIFVKKSANSH